MTIVAANWVGENTSTVGTGPLALSGAISTFCPFSVLPDGSEVYYTLQEGFNRETGIGVVSNGTLTRKVQATLVAGVYTETDIPISLSGNGQVFAVINADFMTRIYNFSLDVADSVAAAAASAKSSSDSASLANDYKTQSAQSAGNAAAYAQSASDSKADATASKNAAAASASAAASSQADALASKNAAKTSETNSKASENASAQYATNASNSAAAALTSQNAAKTSETNAKTSEVNAKASETAAKTSETNAKASETAANSAKNNAQTANVQTQSLYNQTVNLVAGVQAPDKLPTSPGSSRAWMNIAKVKDAGSGFAFVQFIIGGGSNYGDANVPVYIFSISGRGLPSSSLTSNNIDTWFTQRSLVAARSGTSLIKLGVVKNTDNSFDVYLHAPSGYIPEMWLNRLNVQANNGSITGPIIDRTGYSWITTEPAGIVYNSPSDYLMANDSTIPRTNVANTFSQPQVISSTLRVNGLANHLGGVDVTASNGLPLKETTATTGIGVNFIGNNATECSFGIENTAGGTAVFHNYTRGASNSVTKDNQLLGGYGSRPWLGSNYTERSNAALHFLAAGDTSATNHGGWIRLLVTPKGKTISDRVPAFRLSDNGDVWMVPAGAMHPDFDAVRSYETLNAALPKFNGPTNQDGRGLKIVSADGAPEINMIAPRGSNTSSPAVRAMWCDGSLGNSAKYVGAVQQWSTFLFGASGHDGEKFDSMRGAVNIQAPEGWGKTSTPTRILFETCAAGSTSRTARWCVDHNGNFIPMGDGGYDIGWGSGRVNNIYAKNGAINTSDGRMKNDVRAMSDPETEAAKAIAKEIGFWTWKEQADMNDVREHCGLTVQRAMEIMESFGLEPFKYGFICYDKWDEQTVVSEYGPANEDGSENPIYKTIPAGDRYSFRIDELNMFIAKGFEARLSALEDKLGM